MIFPKVAEFDLPALLARYVSDMRRDAFVPGLNKHLLDDVTRYYDTEMRESIIMWHRFGASDAAAIVARELAYFAAIPSFTWKVYADDAPDNLSSILLTAGLKVEADCALMVREVVEVVNDAALGRRAANTQLTIRILESREDIEYLRTVWQVEHAGQDDPWLAVLADALVVHPTSLKIAVGMVDNAPVAAGYIIVDPRGVFAYLGGGATIPRYRGRGAYAALTLFRAQLAAAAKVQYLAVEANAQSAPILARLGFRTLTTLRHYVKR
ncbi:MAG: hypothetical protein ACKO1K_00555 [Burkholderiales bacterium]